MTPRITLYIPYNNPKWFAVFTVTIENSVPLPSQVQIPAEESKLIWLEGSTIGVNKGDTRSLDYGSYIRFQVTSQFAEGT